MKQTELDNFPFYKFARILWEDTQLQQIVKGLHKYEEPFNPASWTSDELVDHALQESVDLVHYLVGLKEKNKELNREIILLRTEIALLRFRLDKGAEPQKPSYLDLDDEI